MKQDQRLRDQLVELLASKDAHLDFDAGLADLPPNLRGVRPQNMPHTAWRLVEHMRIAQWDILEFCRNPKHVSPKFPDGYWPAGDAPPDAKAWERSLAGFGADLQAVCDLVSNPASDLFARIPHGKGQTILREALL